MSSKTAIKTALFFFFGVVACLGLTLFAFLSLIRPPAYPRSVEMTTDGKCGQTEYFRRNGGLLVQQNLCFLTSDAEAEIFDWYGDQGYLPSVGRMNRVMTMDAWVRMVSVERVLVVGNGDGRLKILVYRDATFFRPKSLIPDKFEPIPQNQYTIIPP